MASVPWGAGFWGNPEPKMSKEQLLHHPHPRDTQMTWPGQSHFRGPDEMGHLLHLLTSLLISLT